MYMSRAFIFSDMESCRKDIIESFTVKSMSCNFFVKPVEEEDRLGFSRQRSHRPDCPKCVVFLDVLELG